MSNVSKLATLVRINPPEARVIIDSALGFCKGDRRAAAKALQVSYRTLQRAMLDLGMNADNKDGTTERLLELLAYWGGRMDYGRAAMELYGADSRGNRQRIHTRMNVLAEQGRIRRLDRGVWAF